MIEGAISSFFNEVSHGRLLDAMRRRVRDTRVLRLVRDGLRAKVLIPQTGRFYDVDKGTPQGGILSPLLATIYLHELEVQERKKPTPNPVYRKASDKEGAKRSYTNPFDGTKKARRDPNPVDGTRDLRYVRYADDFILAVQGPRSSAEQIRGDLQPVAASEV